MVTLAQQHLKIRQGLASIQRDPLAWWRFGVRQARNAVALFTDPEPIDELALRAPNKGTKTETAAALVLAILQKRPHLDGVPLPQWRGPVHGLALSLDFGQQKLSVQQTVLRLLGDWPHKAKWKGDDILSSLKIKPLNGSDDESTWSTLTFMSQENKRAGVGARADIVWFDEPPVIEILRELRKAAHAGRRIVRIISFTPTIRRQWEPLKSDYGDSPRGVTRRIGKRWAECRWSLNDVAPWILSPEAKADLIWEYVGDDPDNPRDPLANARIHGDYIDTTGDCPFHIPTLQRMLREAEAYEAEHLRIVDLPVKREREGENGLVIVQRMCEVQVLKDPEPGVDYYVCIDPSRGIETKNHDPGGILVSKMSTGEDVALYEGYIGSHGLGALGAILARQYNNAMVDFENNGGWGEGVLRGLSASGYGRIAKEKKPMQSGEFQTRLGWATTETSRPSKIEAVQHWVDCHAAGAPFAPCRFSRVIQTLLDTIMDEDGKISAAPGYHDEFLILKGQSLLKTRPQKPDLNRMRAIEAAAFIPPQAPSLADMMNKAMVPPQHRIGFHRPKRGPKL